MSGETH